MYFNKNIHFARGQEICYKLKSLKKTKNTINIKKILNFYPSMFPLAKIYHNHLYRKKLKNPNNLKKKN